MVVFRHELRGDRPAQERRGRVEVFWLTVAITTASAAPAFAPTASSASAAAPRTARTAPHSSAPSSRSTRRKIASDDAYVESIPKYESPRAPSVRACV
jgi:hypothetical protein